jgi:hypothetical protein
MKAGQRMKCVGVLVGLAFASSASSADFNMNVTAAGVAFGDHISGPKLSEPDLKGKVVLIEFWGIN